MSFERDGFCVLRGWLPAAAVDALRGDLRARAQLKITDAALEAADLNVDFMGRAFGAASAPRRQRREAWAYAAARGDGDGGGDGAAAAERAVLGQLAAAAADHAGYGSVYLLSEVFVVKPAGSGTEFAWHRDDAKQLAKLGGEAAPDRFCSTWAPLDACGAADGGLVLRSKETERTFCARRRASSSSTATRGTRAAPTPVPMTGASTTPSTPRGPSSGRRRTTAKRRRVAPPPLWFAVAAAPTREALEATLDRANAAPPGYRVVRGACRGALPAGRAPGGFVRFRSPKARSASTARSTRTRS
ncbi:phytanoyl-CoA dioxygenase [Aureococcus anophagefferens]|nr:phytanoyl-CoA dioxygenase [Aureococcus anophagefferens]